METGIKSFRSRCGYKLQSDLAVQLGCSISTVSAWERGARNPSYEECAALLRLGATVEEVFGIDCSKTCPKAIAPVISEDRPLTRSMVAEMIRSELARERSEQREVG